MKFFLQGRLRLSRTAEKAVDDLALFFKNADAALLSKGAPEGEGARVVSWSLEDDIIRIEITSTGPI